MLANTLLTLALTGSAFARPSLQRIIKRQEGAGISSELILPTVISLPDPSATGLPSLGLSDNVGVPTSVISAPSPTITAAPSNGTGSNSDDLEQAAALLEKYIEEAGNNGSAAVLLAEVAKHALDLIDDSAQPNSGAVSSIISPPFVSSMAGPIDGISTDGAGPSLTIESENQASATSLSAVPFQSSEAGLEAAPTTV